MKYTHTNNTFLKDGFPLTNEEILTILNTIPEDRPNKPKISKTMGFSVWYSLYPKKVARSAAIKAWAKNSLYEHAKGQIAINALSEQIRRKDERFQREKQYIMSPATYLNNECWNDEIIVKKQDKKEWLNDSQVDNMARSGESYPELYKRLTGMGFNFNKNRS